MANKRIVIEHTQGRLKGLSQILGTDDQLKAGLRTSDLPVFLASVELGDHQGACSLITVKARYVLYRETFGPPQLKEFNAEQQ